LTHTVEGFVVHSSAEANYSLRTAGVHATGQTSTVRPTLMWSRSAITAIQLPPRIMTYERRRTDRQRDRRRHTERNANAGNRHLQANAPTDQTQ